MQIVWLSTRKHRGKFSKLCCTGVQASLKSTWNISALHWFGSGHWKSSRLYIKMNLYRYAEHCPTEVSESSNQSLAPMKMTFINNFKNNVDEKIWSVHLQN